MSLNLPLDFSDNFRINEKVTSRKGHSLCSQKGQMDTYSQHKHHFGVLALPSLSTNKNGILLISDMILTVRGTIPLSAGKCTAVFPPFTPTKKVIGQKADSTLDSAF